MIDGIEMDLDGREGEVLDEREKGKDMKVMNRKFHQRRSYYRSYDAHW